LILGDFWLKNKIQFDVTQYTDGMRDYKKTSVNVALMPNAFLRIDIDSYEEGSSPRLFQYR